MRGRWLFLFCWLTAPAFAQKVAVARASRLPDLKLSATASFVSQYIFRGERLGGPSFQPSFDLGCGSFALNLWTNFPLKDKLAGQSDPEIDLYGGYTIALNERVKLTPALTFYDYPRAPTDEGNFRSTWEPSLVLDFTVVGVEFAPRVSYDLTMHDAAGELSATYTLTFARGIPEVDLNGLIGTHTAANYEYAADPRLKAWGNYWSLGFVVPYQIRKAGNLSFGWSYTRGSGSFLKRGATPKEANPLIVGRVVVTVGYSRDF